MEIQLIFEILKYSGFSIVGVIGYIYISMFITWLFYLAVMHLKRVKDKEDFSLIEKLFAYPMLYIGLFIDIMFNITSGTIFFLEPPREFLFTSRCQRHLESKKTNFYARYQKRVAKYFCSKFMDPYDEDGHC